MKQSGFQQDQIAVLSRDGHNFTLLEPLVFVTSYGALLTIPAGSTTDGASTPAVIWGAIPPFGKGWKAYILHDWLYRKTRMGKRNCDDLMYEALISLGVDEATAKVIYEGVHLGGQEAFDENRAILDRLDLQPASQ